MKYSISSQYFNAIFKSSAILKTSHITYRFLKTDQESLSGVSFVINKRLGLSVERNKFKRILRSLYSRAFIENNIKIAVIISPKTIKLKKEEIIKSFELLKKNI